MSDVVFPTRLHEKYGTILVELVTDELNVSSMKRGTRPDAR